MLAWGTPMVESNAVTLRPNVCPFPYALAMHAALLNVLFEALKRASARGLITSSDAESLLSAGASRDCSVLRASVEVVLATLEGSRDARQA